MKKLIFYIVIIFSAFQLQAKLQPSEIEKANKAYTNEKYDDAIKLYQKVLDNGLESSELFFNIGNSYFRLANYPMAIYHYEKGKKLNPADDDIDMNLKIANTKIIDKIEPIPQLFFIKWWILFTNIFSYDHWAIFAIFTITAFFVFLFIYLASNSYKAKKISFWLSISMFLITIISLNFAYNQYKNIYSTNTAIIFSPNVTVKSSPDEKGTDKFVIHEGAKVIILDEVNNWVKIKIANGSNGWIEKQTFEII